MGADMTIKMASASASSDRVSRVTGYSYRVLTSISRLLSYLFHPDAADLVRDLDLLDVATGHGDGDRPAGVKLGSRHRHGSGGIRHGGDEQFDVVQRVILPLSEQK